ncbi:MAG: hypothetical protein WBF47_23650, partial [Xanthobacteraceae bacterium]
MKTGKGIFCMRRKQLPHSHRSVETGRRELILLPVTRRKTGAVCGFESASDTNKKPGYEKPPVSWP